MALIMHNFWVFIIKQGKYRTVKPLLVFYILIFLLTSSRIFFNVTFFAQQYNGWIFADEMDPLLNINMGLTMCCILSELALRIH